MANVKNVKNSQYYVQVIQELKERCNERNEDFCFDVTQTRQKFKRCVTLCRNAVMKVKTASGIKRFQEDKELGNWFGKLLPLISSMENCQPQQSIEPGQSQMDSPVENDAEVDDEKSDEEENPVTPDSSDSLASTPSGGSSSKSKKRKSHVPIPTVRKKSLKTETILGEIKEIVQSLKTLSSENLPKDILEFLKEESRRQSERDNAFFQLMTNYLQPNPPTQSMYQPPQQYPHINNNPPPADYGFRYGMTNMRPASAAYSKQDTTQQSYTSQIMGPNYP